MNGADLDHRKIRVDYSITKRPHTPTPGMYMGRPTSGSRYAVDMIIYDEQFVIALLSFIAGMAEIEGVEETEEVETEDAGVLARITGAEDGPG